MANEIGAYEARVRFGELLRRVSAGERFKITHRGSVVAELVPADKAASTVQGAVDAMRSIQTIKGVSTQQLLSMIAEGRR